VQTRIRRKKQLKFSFEKEKNKMKNSKKGFTLVELLVVIAILAILATVAVVGYTSFTRKADISNDTVIAGELNTLLAATDVTDPIESFDDVKAALYANGFYLANLNTKTEGCYFVWDAKNNQIILVDGNDGFKVLYSKVTPSEDKKDWYFAVSDLSKVAAIETAGYNVERMVTDVATLKEALAAGGEFHIDNSLVLDSENLLTFESDVTTTLNLGNASLNTDGVLENQIPIELLKGTLTINGGTIGAAGSYVDADGKVVNSPILTEDATTTYINWRYLLFDELICY
jgi:prepilin-type N-terminal cleavage/methylation domain-containing protein